MIKLRMFFLLLIYDNVIFFIEKFVLILKNNKVVYLKMKDCVVFSNIF